MTPAEERRFIRLWQAEASYREIAQALGCALGTVGSRAAALVAQGKIRPRPRGGAYPRQKAQAALAGVSLDTSGVSARVSPDTSRRSARVSRRVSDDTPPVQYLPPNQGELSPLLHDILQELRHLTGALADRVSPDTPLPAERGKSIRWNLHLSESLREQIKARAKARGLQDSQMVEELLWLALAVVEETGHG
jgi:DNA-binding transcriptional MocR family regulator